VPKLGCRPATSLPVNVSLTLTLSAKLKRDTLLNATEKAFGKAGLLPPGTCGSGQLKPIGVSIGAGNATSRRLSTASSVDVVASSADVNLVYNNDQQALFTKVRVGGSTLQTDLQAAFVKSLVDAGDSSTTATVSVGEIAVEEAGVPGAGATTTAAAASSHAATGMSGLSIAFGAIMVAMVMGMTHF